MTAGSARALAHPNIAFIKYWGNANADLRLPSNGSISLTLGGLDTRTRVSFDPDLRQDTITVDGHALSGEAEKRVVRVLDHIRQLARVGARARVESRNSFPTGAGLASSASGFAALALAATRAAGLSLDTQELSRIARLGSGSACRSAWGGYVEWLAGRNHAGSYAVQIAPPEHWDIRDVVAIVSRRPKAVGSSEGHALAAGSPLQAQRIADAPRRLAVCRDAIVQRDFTSLAGIVEEDSDLMHAVMASSTPPLTYSTPVSLAIQRAVRQWRSEGLPTAYTQDAGPNIHVLCLPEAEDMITTRLRSIAGVLDLIHTAPGGPAREIEFDDPE
ncbi:MAG TPA: diphosphomevalonate decarboxylase [Anaerolineales bacterium]|nr:diphosphomevalonate decarboxylase [Anaerolineales bacterium]